MPTIFVFDNAKSSLVRCTFSPLTTHSTTSLNGIGFARVYSINSLHSHMIPLANLLQLKLLGLQIVKYLKL